MRGFKSLHSKLLKSINHKSKHETLIKTLEKERSNALEVAAKALKERKEKEKDEKSKYLSKMKKNYTIPIISLLITLTIFVFKLYQPVLIILYSITVPAILLHSLILPINKKLSKIVLFASPILSAIILFASAFKLAWVCGGYNLIFSRYGIISWAFCDKFIREVNFEFAPIGYPLLTIIILIITLIIFKLAKEKLEEKIIDKKSAIVILVLLLVISIWIIAYTADLVNVIKEAGTISGLAVQCDDFCKSNFPDAVGIGSSGASPNEELLSKIRNKEEITIVCLCNDGQGDILGSKEIKYIPN